MTRRRGADDGSGAGTAARSSRRPVLIAAAGLLAAGLCAAGAAFTDSNYTLVGFAPEFAIWFSAWQTVPILIAVFRPFVAWWVFVASLLAPLAIRPIDPSEPWPLLPTALISYLLVQVAVARGHRLLLAVPAWLLAVFGVVLVASTGDPGLDTSTDVTLFTLVSALALVVGAAARVRAQAQARLAVEERLTADERSRRLLLEERARIAREMHDIVAHHMSMIAVQASTAEYRIGGLTPAVKEEFDAIGQAARESMTEMRRLLRVLRNEQDDTPRAPQPGLADLVSLADATERAGTPVTLTVEDLPDGVAELVGLTAYRVVQEALSNVVRHGAGAPTTVGVRADDTCLTVSVVNAAPPGPATLLEEPRAGHGLTGMRERVALVGGTLRFGPAAADGFGVEAVLPLHPDPAAPADPRGDSERGAANERRGTGAPDPAAAPGRGRG